MATELRGSRTISPARMNRWRAAYQEEPLRRVIGNAVVKNGIQSVAHNHRRLTEMTYAFSHEIPTGAITSQNKSGRCWLFAGLNVIRERMSKRLNLKDLELSQAYLMFYDKLEKSNYFLESILATTGEPTDGRLVSWLLMAPLQDGGQWDMFVNLVEKYGIVPKWVMPESFHSSDSNMMNRLLTAKLREDAARLRGHADRGASEDALLAEKEAMLQDVYMMLCHFLGEPPATFTLEYQDDDRGYHVDRGLTPVEFWNRYSDVRLDDFVSVINAPTPDKPFGKAYTVDYLGNVVDGRRVLYLNLAVEEFKALAQQQLLDGRPVWFGCDVGQMSDRSSGLLDTEQFDYGAALGVNFGLSKGERLMYGESLMTHAMVLTGVNLDADGRPDRWKVENSWGPSAGSQGFFVMSDAWFDQFMYQIVVDKAYLTEAQRTKLAEEPLHLPPWDPMGSLAH